VIVMLQTMQLILFVVVVDGIIAFGSSSEYEEEPQFSKTTTRRESIAYTNNIYLVTQKV